jgi:hypothetical protein
MDSERVTIAEGMATDVMNLIAEVAQCKNIACVNQSSTTLYMIKSRRYSEDTIFWLERGIHERHQGKRTMTLAEICPTCNRVVPGYWHTSPQVAGKDGKPVIVAYCDCGKGWGDYSESMIRVRRGRLLESHGLDDVLTTGSRRDSAKKDGWGPSRQD